MKKIVGLILLAVMVLIAVPAKSQIKFGIKGGLNISSVHFNKDLVGKSIGDWFWCIGGMRKIKKKLNNFPSSICYTYTVIFT